MQVFRGIPEQADQPAVLTIGNFDGVHRGHGRILDGADAVLTFVNHPLTVLDPPHAPPLLMDVDERLALLETEGARQPRAVRALRFTPAFAAQPPAAFADFLRRAYPSLARIHCGGNWRFGAKGAGTPALLRTLGFDVKVARYVRYRNERISSTRIRAALAEGNVEDACAMLGRPFAVTGAVVPGKGLGRHLSAPTLNVAVAPPLKRGVYAVSTSLGPGLANYGVAPTMGRKAWTAPVLEVHLLEGTGLFAPPARLRTEFRAFLRPERTFASVAALRDQIVADIAAARSLRL